MQGQCVCFHCEIRLHSDWILIFGHFECNRVKVCTSRLFYNKLNIFLALFGTLMYSEHISGSVSIKFLLN